MIEPIRAIFIKMDYCDFCKNYVEKCNLETIDVSSKYGWRYCDKCTESMRKNTRVYKNINKIISWNSIAKFINMTIFDLAQINVIVKRSSGLIDTDWNLDITRSVSFFKDGNKWKIPVSKPGLFKFISLDELMNENINIYNFILDYIKENFDK